MSKSLYIQKLFVEDLLIKKMEAAFSWGNPPVFSSSKQTEAKQSKAGRDWSVSYMTKGRLEGGWLGGLAHHWTPELHRLTCPPGTVEGSPSSPGQCSQELAQSQETNGIHLPQDTT